MRGIVFLVLAVALLAPIDAWRTFLRGRSKHGNLGMPAMSEEYTEPQEQWFEQRVDHFGVTQGPIWKQRYFVNSTHYKKGGPVFLLIGGEGEASAKWMVRGQWLDYARQYGALCLQLEHRFYGKSRPAEDLSVKNLMMLSSEQALADLMNFTRSMKTQYKLPAGTKWIAFGGSYAGSLAAWLRLKYPHIVHGAVSASGPLLAEIDFQQYYVTVEDSLRQHSQACVDAMIEANRLIHIALDHRIGRTELTESFKLCDPLHPSNFNTMDIANFYATLAGNFAEVVQFNRVNRIGSKTVSYTIDAVCDILVDDKRGTPVERLAAVSNMLLEASKEKCLDYRYSKMIDELRNDTWASEMAEGARQWMYQTCTEFGFFQTSTARRELFSETFPKDFFVQQCTDIFGTTFGIDNIENFVERVNAIYGGKDIEVSNVVFVHGSIDPWHALGITESSKPHAPAIYINGTAHCANLYPASSDDLPQLAEARKRIGELIGEWLKI